MIDPFKPDIGRRVAYTSFVGSPPEFGVITSFNPDYVFVKYDGDAHSKATLRENLEWEDEYRARYR